MFVLSFPFLVFLAAFLFDKVFFIDHLEDYFLTTISFVNFDHKERMLGELREYLKQPDHRHTLVVFGNSRTMGFSRTYIEKKYPGWTLFNFSVPGGTTDYFYYLMTRFRDEDIRPDAVYFTVTPQGMNDTAPVALDEVMVFGLPLSFITREAAAYKMEDLTNYLVKKMFLVHCYRPKLRTVQYRLSGTHLLDFRRFLEFNRESLEKERGSVPFDLDYKPPQNEKLIEENAASIWKDSFVPFRLSHGQVNFTEQSLKIARDMGVRRGLLWPRVSEPLRRRKSEEKVALDSRGQPTTVQRAWEPLMRDMAGRYGAVWMDFNFDPARDLHCDLFFDASHMASGCMGAFMDSIMHEVTR